MVTLSLGGYTFRHVGGPSSNMDTVPLPRWLWARKVNTDRKETLDVQEMFQSSGVLQCIFEINWFQTF